MSQLIERLRAERVHIATCRMRNAANEIDTEGLQSLLARAIDEIEVVRLQRDTLLSTMRDIVRGLTDQVQSHTEQLTRRERNDNVG